jgi:sulfur-oxidizing protein SoxY
MQSSVKPNRALLAAPSSPGLENISRHFSAPLLGVMIAGLLFLGTTQPAAAQAARPVWERISRANELLDGATPRANAIRLDLPAVTQDGSSIPLTVEIDSPMTGENFIEALYLFAPGNPSPELAEFRFTPLAGKARLETRIRLNQSQSVVALARTSRGEWLAGARDIRVTVSGCLSRGGSSEADDFMRARVRAPSRMKPGEPGDVRTLINHPMETGLRKAEDGKVIPEKIINEFRAALGTEPVVTARFHRAVAANPYLLFYVAAGLSGELTLEWKEDSGLTASATARIPPA